MAELTRDETRYYHLSDVEEYPVAAGVIVYEGAAVGENGSGYARPLVAGDQFLGFASKRASNVAGVPGAERVPVKTTGLVKLLVGGVDVASNLGAYVYATNDGTFTVSAAGSKVGKIHKVESNSYALVRIEVASKSSETPSLTWATKPTASVFRRGQAWFSDIGAMGYSDGIEWVSTEIIKSKSLSLKSAVWRYPLSSTNNLDNSYWFYVPINVNGDYAYFGVGKWSPSGAASWNMSRFGVGRIGTQIWNTAGTGVTKVGTWTASTPAGAYAGNTYSATAGESIEFVTAGHTLVSRSTTSTNAGYAIVAIDGDFTKANRLPVFTSTDLSNGLCRSTDVGKRYINTYASSIYPDYHLILADGLEDTSHTVKFEATGTKSSASSATRAYIGGVIGCGASDAGQEVNGTRVVAHIIPVNDARTATGSAVLFTPEVEKATAPGTFEFLGDVHLAETSESLALQVDGTDNSSLSAGSYLSGSVINLYTSATIASTDATSTPVLRKRIDLTFSSNNTTHPLVVSMKCIWLVDKKCRAVYPLMLPMGSYKAGGSVVKNEWWDSCIFGEYVSAQTDFTTNGGASNGKVPALKAIIKSALHNYVASVEFLDNGSMMNYFQKSAPLNVFLHDRTDGYDKVYFCRSNSFNLESFVVGDVIQGSVGFDIKLNS